MTGPFTPCIGAVFSADIAVPEHDREVSFYARVLGTGGDPLWREDLMSNMGTPIIGLGQRVPEYSDLPLQWMPHVQVDDIAASVQRCTDLGGRVLMHERDENGMSQWALLLDANGAAFGVIPVIPEAMMPDPGDAAHDAASVGRIAWLDLTVANATDTRDFYREVIGWSVQEVGMTDGELRYADFNMLGADGAPSAGVCHARGENQGLPPVWMIYLPVGDLAESLRRVDGEGGKVIKVTQNEAGQPAYAVIEDPVGASLALAQA
ncbi:MAG: VOC family protein [Gammaproteobacteria bacterium]|nr:VOC family protein [Gammaproteobacteria bacterium]